MIRLKCLLRNLFRKPLRAAVLFLTLGVVAFAFLFCMAQSEQLDNEMNYDAFKSYGSADLTLSAGIRSTESEVTMDTSLLPAGAKWTGVVESVIDIPLQDGEFSKYVRTVDVKVFGLIPDEALDFGFLSDTWDVSQGCAISQILADRFGYKVGDTITFRGTDGAAYDLNIAKILTNELLLEPFYAILTTPDIADRILCFREGTFSYLLIDLPESENAEEYADFFAMHGYMAEETQLKSGFLSETRILFLIMFFVLAVMAGAVCVILAKQTVTERLPLIGTMRSVGGSIPSTTRFLVAENAVSGLIGGLIGAGAFAVINSLVNMDMTAQIRGLYLAYTEKAPELPPLTVKPLWYVAAVLAPAVLQSICAVGAVMKTVKIPVRDIIFGTREVPYVQSKLNSVTGIVLIIGGALCVISSSAVLIILGIVLLWTGSIFVLPLLLELISVGLFRVFSNAERPVGKMAALELARKKSNVHTAQLTLATMALSVMIFGLTVSLGNVFLADTYNCDIIMENPMKEFALGADSVRQIEGVVSVDPFYAMYDNTERPTAEINGTAQSLSVYGYNGSDSYIGIKGLPESLNDDEFCIDEKLAKKYGLQVGDTVDITLRSDFIRPSELSLKLVGVCNTLYFDNERNGIAISSEQFKRVYHDDPQRLLIRTEADKTERIKNLLKKSAPNEGISVKDHEEYLGFERGGVMIYVILLGAVIFFGCLLTVMGNLSAAIIGFIQSRRKFAVLYSICMDKKRLRSLIMTETLLRTGVSLAASVLLGTVLTLCEFKAMSQTDMRVDVTVNVPLILVFMLAIGILLMMSALIPISYIYKMNAAQEIRCE